MSVLTSLFLGRLHLDFALIFCLNLPKLTRFWFFFCPLSFFFFSIPILLTLHPLDSSCLGLSSWPNSKHRSIIACHHFNILLATPEFIFSSFSALEAIFLLCWCSTWSHQLLFLYLSTTLSWQRRSCCHTGDPWFWFVCTAGRVQLSSPCIACPQLSSFLPYHLLGFALSLQICHVYVWIWSLSLPGQWQDS